MARTKNTPAARPDTARSAAHGAPPPVPAPDVGPAPDSAAAAVLAALSAHPGGVTAARAADAAGISRAAARGALTALETAGAITRTRGGKPGTPDTWHPAASQPGDPANTPPAASDPPGTDPAGLQPAGSPGPDSAAAAEAPAAETAASKDETAPAAHDEAAQPGDSPGDGSSPDGPAPAAGPGHHGQASPGDTSPGEPGAGSGDTPASDAEAGPDPAVTAEAGEQAGQISVAAQAVTTALAAGDLRAALAGIEEICEQAARARRALKTAASGKKTPGARPGGLREKVAAHLRAHPDASFTPHEIHKVLGNSSGAIANALDTLAGLGQAELACEKPRRFRHAATTPPAAEAAGDAGAERELAGAA